jgi:hypothetical protein
VAASIQLQQHDRHGDTVLFEARIRGCRSAGVSEYG